MEWREGAGRQLRQLRTAGPPEPTLPTPAQELQQVQQEHLREQTLKAEGAAEAAAPILRAKLDQSEVTTGGRAFGEALSLSQAQGVGTAA